MKIATAFLISAAVAVPAPAQTRTAPSQTTGTKPSIQTTTGTNSSVQATGVTRVPGQSTDATKPTQTTDARPAPPRPIGTSGAAGAAISPDYRLSFGDKLRIEVYREPQLSQSVEVRPDGKITLPLVGDIPAAGTTTGELAATLTERLREYVTTPVVTVIVSEATPPVVYVMGEVNAPGSQPVRGPLTVLQALAVAGGFREFANPKKIRILRKTARGTVETIRFNYKEALESTGEPLLLQPGDTVIVP